MKLPARRPSRVVVEPVAPVVSGSPVTGGQFASKVSLGEPLVIEADVFADGHDAIDAAVRWSYVDASGKASRKASDWSEAPMQFVGNDRWTATIEVTQTGRLLYDVVGWSNPPQTWRKGIIAKIDAGIDVAVERLDGLNIVTDLLTNARRAKGAQAKSDVAALEGLASQLRSGTDAEVAQMLGVTAGETTGETSGESPSETAGETSSKSWSESDWAACFWRNTTREPLATLPAPLPVDVDRERARFSAWYEFFPRSSVTKPSGKSSSGKKKPVHATLRDAIDRLDYIAAMGFNVVYLPPVSPIGLVHRKGVNNNPVAQPGDVGSPWGIADHTAVHPDLGTLADFRDFVAACTSRDLELALDIAFQVAPDHPWVEAHPGWFTQRADGSIQYAENPPKKYQDIYPINFETDDWESLWNGLADVFRFWIEQGVKIFRVDNPHTKAFPFWEWCIATLRQEHPDTIFLAEAFTRPRVMERLAKLGYNQSYTYFTWRRTANELREYFTDLSTRTVDYYRPNAWPNTPDILMDQLQEGGRVMFETRAILAATLSANWGIYGPAFELLEHAPLKPGSEEYLNSEKYQLRTWNLNQPDSLAPLLTQLNSIRAAQPALQHLRTLRFHRTDNDQMLCFTKTDPNGVGDPVLVVVNADAGATHGGLVHVDPTSFGIGLGHDDEYDLVDLLGGDIYRWRGWSNYVELGPSRTAHIFSVRRPVYDM